MWEWRKDTPITSGDTLPPPIPSGHIGKARVITHMRNIRAVAFHPDGLAHYYLIIYNSY